MMNIMYPSIMYKCIKCLYTKCFYSCSATRIDDCQDFDTHIQGIKGIKGTKKKIKKD